MDRPGQRLGKAFEHLGPVAIKLGQVLATRADIFGTEFATDLGRLKDKLEPFPTDQARREIEKSLGRTVESLFLDLGDPIGAASLAHLGKRQFRSRAPGVTIGEAEPEPAGSMFRRGLLVNLTNPKAVVFFLAFMPQFVVTDRPLLPQYAVLAATVVVIDVVVMWFFFAAAARGLGRLARRESGQRTINRVFGGLFVGVGVLLAAVH